ncbi:ubiquitin-like autophagy protein Apg12-domain-containing protein [Mycena capillaripes]|nr:ubiquitin-like autophagy protein Apg12-domain-containing protein [Mycena capillaripes]
MVAGATLLTGHSTVPFTTLPETNPDDAALAALETHVQQAANDSGPVILQFRAVNNAPILKQTEFKLSRQALFHVVMRNLRKKLGMKNGEPLFAFLQSAFAPAPDEVLGNLYESFATPMKNTRILVVYYSSTPAWG